MRLVAWVARMRVGFSVENRGTTKKEQEDIYICSNIHHDFCLETAKLWLNELKKKIFFLLRHRRRKRKNKEPKKLFQTIK